MGLVGDKEIVEARVLMLDKVLEEVEVVEEYMSLLGVIVHILCIVEEVEVVATYMDYNQNPCFYSLPQRV
jgi:hypothetical protein